MSRWPDWLGLSEKRWVRAENEEIRPAKTAWDWLQLLVVPVALAVLAIAFNSWQSSREADRERARAEREREFAEETRLDDTLRAYIAQMSELVLDRKLLSSRSGSEVQALARTLTLTTLQRLDGARKGEVLQYLIESGLIRVRDPKIRLAGADLSSVELNGLRLTDIDLSDTMLWHGRFFDAVLSRVKIDGADASYALFDRAALLGVSLMGTRLPKASFDFACLYDVRLVAADLSAAAFKYSHGDRVDFTEAALDEISWTDAEFTNSQFAGTRGSWPPGWGNPDSRPSPSNDPRPSTSVDGDGDGEACER
jgi:uncharacterized protein YjbI with pentapeptide repeats